MDIDINRENSELLKDKSQEIGFNKKGGERSWKCFLQSGVISADPIQVGAVSFDPAQHSIQIQDKTKFKINKEKLRENYILGNDEKVLRIINPETNIAEAT